MFIVILFFYNFRRSPSDYRAGSSRGPYYRGGMSFHNDDRYDGEERGGRDDDRGHRRDSRENARYRE